MTSKTSSSKLINKTILKKTIFRFWPLWALYLVIQIFLMPANLFMQVRNVHPTDAADYALGYASSQAPSAMELFKHDLLRRLLDVLNIQLFPLLTCVAAVIAAVAVFSYLYGTRSCNMMHAFPVTRTELFTTHYVAGLLFMVVPQVIVTLLTIAVCGVFGIPHPEYVLLWLVMTLGYTFFFYSLAVFCCMLTGNIFPGFCFYFLFNLFYGVFANLISCLTNEICYGVVAPVSTDDYPGMWLSPLIYLCNDARPEFAYDRTLDDLIENVFLVNGAVVGVYCIPAVILIILAIMLYRRRQLECAAEMTAHRFVKPMTRWLVSMVAALGMALAFVQILFPWSQYFLMIFLIMLVVCSFVVFFVLEMAIHKKFRIFKKPRVLEWAVCAVLLLAITGLIEGDAFGIEKKLPDPAKTKAVIINTSHEMLLTEPEQIQEILLAHQNLIDNKAFYEDLEEEEAGYIQYVNLEYILSDGTALKRNYSALATEEALADPASAAAIIRRLQEENQTYLQSWLCVNYEDIEMRGGVFYNFNDPSLSKEDVEYGNPKQQTISKEDMDILYAAMLQDIAENNNGCLIGEAPYMDKDKYGDMISAHIRLDFMLDEEPIRIWDQIRQIQDHDYGVVTAEAVAPDILSVSQEGMHVSEAHFELYSTCTHTIDALIELGYISDISDLYPPDM